jgi:hypothetical protein
VYDQSNPPGKRATATATPRTSRRIASV